MYAYLDESGDLGFSPNSTKHFIIALLIPKDPKAVANCIKRIRQRKLHKSQKEVPEFKFNNSNFIIRNSILDCIARKDVEIHGIVLKKHQVRPHLYDHKNEVYNYVTKFLIEKIIMPPSDGSITVCVDKFLSKENRENYNTYISSVLKQKLRPGISVELKHADSQCEPCIQAVDFVAGALFRKFEFDDNTFFNLIEEKTNLQILWK